MAIALSLLVILVFILLICYIYLRNQRIKIKKRVINRDNSFKLNIDAAQNIQRVPSDSANITPIGDLYKEAGIKQISYYLDSQKQEYSRSGPVSPGKMTSGGEIHYDDDVLVETSFNGDTGNLQIIEGVHDDDDDDILPIPHVLTPGNDGNDTNSNGINNSDSKDDVELEQINAQISTDELIAKECMANQNDINDYTQGIVKKHEFMTNKWQFIIINNICVIYS